LNGAWRDRGRIADDRSETTTSHPRVNGLTTK
jgi:hypothetical protein